MSWLSVDTDVEAGEDKVYTGYNGITETGAYPMKILMAKVVPSATSSAESIVFDFETRDGKTISAKLWIKSSKTNAAYYVDRKTGKKVALPDVIKLNAIGTILGLESAPRRQEAMVEEYDFDAKADVPKKREVFPELIGKFIGGCVTMTRYNKQEKQGDEYVAIADDYTVAEITHYYRVEDEKFASEIKEGKSAKELDKWRSRNNDSYVHDRRTIKDAAPATAQSSSAGTPEPEPESAPTGW